MIGGELIKRLEYFPPEFPVFARLGATDRRVVAPVKVRIDLSNPATLVAIPNHLAIVPDDFVDSVVLFPCAMDDDRESIAHA